MTAAGFDGQQPERMSVSERMAMFERGAEQATRDDWEREQYARDNEVGRL